MGCCFARAGVQVCCVVSRCVAWHQVSQEKVGAWPGTSQPWYRMRPGGEEVKSLMRGSGGGDGGGGSNA